ncbi:hypothetical protein HPB52_015222 [Rhipicephalus sanguineus]|uniref:Uncharacterized protein n=1 Tax=Rhipicephalus sanguineus TaxID=34632 RepID=A0A9D4T3Y8_RHISA|nr:hypothetical protein HPB52_015222 [Rhipicephalus sanguineus]
MSDEEHGLVGEPHEGSKALESGNAASQDTSPSGQGDVEAGSGPSKEHTTTESSRLDNQDASSRSQETRDIVIFVTLVAVAGIYLVVSSKLILDYLEIPAMYLDNHITKSTLCSNLYGSVCNDNYFYNAERKDSSLWPYRYSSLYLIYNALQKAIHGE